MPSRSLSKRTREENMPYAIDALVRILARGPLHVCTVEVTRSGVHYLHVFGADVDSEGVHFVANLTWHVAIAGGYTLKDRNGTWQIAMGGYGYSRETDIAETLAYKLRAHFGDALPLSIRAAVESPQRRLVRN